MTWVCLYLGVGALLGAVAFAREFWAYGWPTWPDLETWTILVGGWVLWPLVVVDTIRVHRRNMQARRAGLMKGEGK